MSAYSGTCAKAIDGDLYGSLAGQTCASTGSQTNPWWRVDLLKEYEVETVKITSRSDSMNENYHAFEIRVGESGYSSRVAGLNCGNI